MNNPEKEEKVKEIESLINRETDAYIERLIGLLRFYDDKTPEDILKKLILIEVSYRLTQ